MTRQAHSARVISRTRNALAVSSYGILVAIVLGYIDSITAVDRSLEMAGPIAHVALTLALIATAALAMVCWGTAVWYAIAIGRRGLAVLLAFTNFVGGFFFYFGYVARQPKPRREENRE